MLKLDYDATIGDEGYVTSETRDRGIDTRDQGLKRE
jgi:hypothetical protein